MRRRNSWCLFLFVFAINSFVSFQVLGSMDRGSSPVCTNLFASSLLQRTTYFLQTPWSENGLRTNYFSVSPNGTKAFLAHHFNFNTLDELENFAGKYVDLSGLYTLSPLYAASDGKPSFHIPSMLSEAIRDPIQHVSSDWHVTAGISVYGDLNLRHPPSRHFDLFDFNTPADEPVIEIALSSDGTVVAALDSSRVITIFNTETKQILREIHIENRWRRLVSNIPFTKQKPLAKSEMKLSQHGNILIYKDTQGSVRAYQISTGRYLNLNEFNRALHLISDVDRVQSFEIHPNGRNLISLFGDGTIRVFDMLRGDWVEVFDSPQQPPVEIEQRHSLGAKIASAVPYQMDNNMNLRINENGTHILVSSHNHVRVYTIDGHFISEYAIASDRSILTTDVSRDGQIVYIISHDPKHLHQPLRLDAIRK